MGNALAHGGIGPMSDGEPDASNISTYVEDTDEVKWVIHWAMDRDISTPVTGMSQQMLMAYRDLDWPEAKSMALLRNQYGGHAIHRARRRRPASLTGARTKPCTTAPPPTPAEQLT